MSTLPSFVPSPPSFFDGLRIQHRVIGALFLREMHTRFGRDNIGYLWMIGEPTLLATVIGIMHASGHTEYGSNISPLPLAVLGYTIFIMFRGIVNRAEGMMEGSAPLLYHKTVSVEDVTIARAILEGGGTVANLVVMLSALVALGFAETPARPLWLMFAVFFMVWNSWAQSLIVVAISHDNRTAGRLVHVYTYFNIPLSGAFVQVEWLPHPMREYAQWLFLPHIFEMARYGMFEAAKPDYFDVLYLAGWTVTLNIIGLLACRIIRRHIHL